MKLGISEILRKANDAPDDHARLHILRINDSPTLRNMLNLALDKNVKWQLPDGIPPYKPNDLVDQHHRMYTEMRKMYLFIEGGSPNLKQLRRETLFIELLESLDPEDAKLVLAAKDKYIPYNNITVELINIAFPGLINNV
jgi:hypothetical protein